MARDWGEKLTASIPILTLGVGILAWYAEVPEFWLVFVVGWVVLTPLAGILFGDEEGELEEYAKEAAEAEISDAVTGEPSSQDALDTLRDRYARGELTEEQFEQKVERLLETETVEDARDRMTGAGETDAGERTRERTAERER